MTKQIVTVPDIGGTEGAEVVEVSIAVGDSLEQEQAMVVLETDKASMDVPCPVAGRVSAVIVKEGDKVSEGDPLLELDVAGGAETADSATTDNTNNSNTEAAVATAPPAAASDSATVSSQVVSVPDGAEDADIIEILVAAGDEVAEGDSLIVLETDKASMEVPAPQAGTIVSITAKQGDKTQVGGELLLMDVVSAAPAVSSATASATSAAVPSTTAPSTITPAPAPSSTAPSEATVVSASQSQAVYAGPAVRKFAREMAVELTAVVGTGERGRITKDDVKAYVKQVMSGQKAAPAGGGMGAGIPPVPPVDFTQFGEIELQPMSKIKKLTAANMSRNWLNIPHVTQFDDADITELESFRKSLKAEAEKRGVKLTPLPFLLKACAAALVAEPSFNVSLHHDGEHIVQKNYVHIGVAVDSPIGLVVPVIRDVDKKGLWELAADFMALVNKAREGKLAPKDMQGGCFTLSSLGAMGGTGFTPIVNAPEVAILGVSRAQVKPVWNGSEFAPRTMLPLSLSYDHRAINGGDAGRFFSYLNSVIADVRRLLL
ncbi:MAG: dihydrolipoyllysine-residue acetyltransferase [Cellvibrionaceae bacterium]|nr:dihydrolipoyllysine-residue acetyltransferase [Cellvibrionaceae bacterium]